MLNGAKHYIGEFADDAAAEAAISARRWDTDGDGNGDPQPGSLYYNTADAEVYAYDGAQWAHLNAVSFLELTDAPKSYVGLGGQVVAVKATADGLETIDMGTSDITIAVDPDGGGDYSTIAAAIAAIPAGSAARDIIITLAGSKSLPKAYSEKLTLAHHTEGTKLTLCPAAADADVRTPVVACQAGGSTTVVKIAKAALAGTAAGEWAGCAITVAQGQGKACVGQQRTIDGNGAVANGTDWDFTVTSAFGSAIGAACKVVIDSIIVGDGSSSAVSHPAGHVRIEDICTSGRWTVDGGAVQVGPVLHIDRATMAAGAETIAIVAAQNKATVTFQSSTHCVIAGAARALSLQNRADALCFPTSATIYFSGGSTNLINLIAGAMMAARDFASDCNAGSWGAQMGADVGSLLSVYAWTMYGSDAATKTLSAANNATIRYQTPTGHTVVDATSGDGQISHY